MLFVKLMKIAFILKDLNLDQYFKDSKCEVDLLVASLKPEIIMQLAEVATGAKIVSEVDAIAGIVNFCLSLAEQAKTSPQLATLVQSLPLPQKSKEAISKLLGKISVV